MAAYATPPPDRPLKEIERRLAAAHAAEKAWRAAELEAALAAHDRRIVNEWRAGRGRA